MTIRGSPAYWSPEIFYRCGLKQKPDGGIDVEKTHIPYDPYQSDIYSLGITILQMMKLQSKFERTDLELEVYSC